MSKVYTQQLPVSRDFVKAEDYNEEARNLLAEFNGQLDAQQMPLSSFDATRFSQGADIDASITNGTGQVLPSSLYARTTTAITAMGQSVGATNNILGPPSKVYETGASEWQPGWNALSLYMASGVKLSIPAQEGTLKGTAITDVAFYLGDKANMVGSGVVGNSWRVEIGVFVDNVLVARTGYQPPKRHSYCLPFAIPVPTRPITIDIRWRGLYDGLGPNAAYYYVSDTNVSIYNSTLWVRNQYR